jgi:hypothetical protein
VLRGDEGRSQRAKTAKTATNVESNARHSHEGSNEGWWDLSLIDDRNEWAVTTLAMTFSFLGSNRARHQRNRL